MNEFDNLYNEFFKGKGKADSELTEGMKKMLKFVDKLNSGSSLGNINPEENEMGPPTTRRLFEEDGVNFEECTWDTEFGTIVRIATVGDVEFEKDYFDNNGLSRGEVIDEAKLSLEEKLEIAEDVEDYETCILLRDEIKARDEEKIAGELKNNKGIPKKDKKDEVSENLDNKGFPENDEYNF